MEKLAMACARSETTEPRSSPDTLRPLPLSHGYCLNEGLASSSRDAGTEFPFLNMSVGHRSSS